MNTAYTEKFEYASQMVKAFIENEIIIASTNKDTIFSDESWLSNFFCFNMNQLTFKEVEKQLNNLLDNKSGQKSYNTTLARVHALYSSLVMGCGIEFINELESNCVYSLTYLNDDTRKERGNTYKFFRRIFNQHPELIVSALGNARFSMERVKFNHQHRDSLMSSK